MRLKENVGGRHPNETLINFGFGFINLDLDSDEIYPLYWWCDHAMSMLVPWGHAELALSHRWQALKQRFAA